MLIHKLRLTISKYSFFETSLLILALLLLGYIIDPTDPLLIHSEISYLVSVLAIVTLFHGVANGLFSLFLLGIAMKFFYPYFPIESFLKVSVFVLIFGEFHYFWNRKIVQNSTKNDYLNMKLDELSNAFYTLKISHDQLEKNYVFKPMSIRNSIRQLKDAYKENKDYFQNFLLLLEKSFNVTEAEFCAVHKKNVYHIHDTDFKHKMDSSDPMIEMALAKKTPIYVSSEEVENNSKYLAVIPIVSKNEVKALLLVKKMPFMSFNKDNLISISVIIAYFLDELDKWSLARTVASERLEDDEFYFEMQRLHELFEEFDVNSTVLVMRTEDKLLSHLVEEKIRENLRSLDMVASHNMGGIEVIAVLFPFADQASAKGFLTRLYKLLKLDIEDERTEYSLFDISELKIIQEYAGIADDAV